MKIKSIFRKRFKNKYHPVDSVRRKEEQLGFLKNRVAVFNELLDNGQIKSVTIDTTQQDPLLRLLDTVVIKLEGGTDDDLKVLDEKPRDIVYPDRVFESRQKKEQPDDDVIITSVEKRRTEEDEPKLASPRPTQRATAAGSDEENWDEDDAVDSPKKPVVNAGSDKEDHKGNEKKKEKKSLKRKRTNSDSSSTSTTDTDSSSSSSSDEDDDDEKVKDKYNLEKIKQELDEDAAVKVKVEPAAVEEQVAEKIIEPVEKAIVESQVEAAEKQVENGEATPKDAAEEAAGNADTLDDIVEKVAEIKDKPADGEEEEVVAEKEVTNVAEHTEKPAEAKITEDDVAVKSPTEAETTKDDFPVKTEIVEGVAAAADPADNAEPAKPADGGDDDNEPETIDLDKVKDGPQPRALHRTSSIFLRNLAPTITKAEIEAICQRFDGYLRVAIADPLVERRWYRRGWVTFKRDVNIKEICWNLNNTRLRDCEMGAIVNRDLSRRVRPVNGLTAHKTVVRSDIKLCAKIAMNLDEKMKLWDRSNAHNAKSNGNPDNFSSYGFKSNNPVLQNITDYLIEEASAEEEELLGITGENKETDGETIERDPQLISVLDCLILYLRIVHSVDFYNHCEYPYEDEMPNRCGIIHARGPAPLKVSQNELQDYIKNFESKMQQFLAKTTTIDEDELKNLGSKDAEKEVEKFIQANTQELAKDKWLCPLSGKKFKGPEFIRKHIFNKHVEKVDEVRKEVEFFNNYLKDPKRPQLPEHPGATKRTNSESSGGYRPPPIYPPAYIPPYAAYAPPMMMPGRGRGFGGGRRPGNEYRQLIQYRDLDAPQEPVDLFN